MANNNKTQKKKTTLHLVLDILFKILLAVVLIFFILIMYKKFNFSTGGFDFNSVNKNKNQVKMPQELKWFDDFKGIENVPDKNQLEDSDEPKKLFTIRSPKE